MENGGPRYETQVARRLLATTANHLLPRIRGREEAGERLIPELIDAVNGYCGWYATGWYGGCSLSLSSHGRPLVHILVRHDGEGSFSLHSQLGQGSERPAREIRLHLNPDTNLLESTEIEEELEPVLGGLRPRQSGVGAIVRAVLAMVEDLRTSGG